MKLILLAVLTATCAIGQTQPLKFDIASVKPQKWTLPATVGLKFEGATFHAEHMQLGDLILFAYDLKGHFQVSGLPDWAKFDTVMDAASFQIDAKASPGQTPTKEEFRLMLQALLADRFHLQIHHENRDVPVYYLTVGKGGPKLNETAGGKTDLQQHQVGRVGMRENATNVTIPYAVERGLGFYSGRPLLDKTGLTGSYDFTLEWLLNPTNVDASGAGADLPSFGSALQEQLGLKLESATAPYDTIVIDHAGKPSEN